jgi:hypothetical protein
VAFDIIAEIILVLYFIILADFLSESDMMEWADTTIACTGDYMAGAYVDTPSQKSVGVAVFVGIDGPIPCGASQKVAQYHNHTHRRRVGPHH